MKRTLVHISFVTVALLGLACQRQEEAHTPAARTIVVAGGNAAHGKELLVQYGCGSCHQIPGVAGAQGVVGPSLEHTAAKAMLANKLQNDPTVMQQWLQNPQSLDPQSTMPNLGVTPPDARDLAAFLYTLQ
jgi:cytochrome c